MGKRKMDSTESLVADNLRARGFKKVVYEPDGNVPPDFLADGRVAIEARRLSQHDDQANPKSLEETAIPFGKDVRQALTSFGPPLSGTSWFVIYTFSRPIPRRNVAIALITDALLKFAVNPEAGLRTVVMPNLRLRFTRASRLHQTMFVLGGSMDHDGGGWVLGDLEKNLKICIADKTAKTAKFRPNHSEWWLALVDYIAYGQLDVNEQQELRRLISPFLGGWDKVVLVSPLDATLSFDL